MSNTPSGSYGALIRSYFGSNFTNAEPAIMPTTMHMYMGIREEWWSLEMTMQILQAIEVPNLWCITAKKSDTLIFHHWILSDTPITKEVAAAHIVAQIQKGIK